MMTEKERREVETNLGHCRAAVAEFERMLAADTAAKSAAATASDAELVAKAGKRSMKEGILLARELGRRGGPQD